MPVRNDSNAPLKVRPRRGDELRPFEPIPALPPGYQGPVRLFPAGSYDDAHSPKLGAPFNIVRSRYEELKEYAHLSNAEMRKLATSRPAVYREYARALDQQRRAQTVMCAWEERKTALGWARQQDPNDKEAVGIQKTFDRACAAAEYADDVYRTLRNRLWDLFPAARMREGPYFGSVFDRPGDRI